MGDGFEDKEKKMNCPICKGKFERGSSTFSAEIENGLLFVKDVPADICKQCGEVFIPDEVAETLENLVFKAKKEKVEMEIISYKMAA